MGADGRDGMAAGDIGTVLLTCEGGFLKLRPASRTNFCTAP